MPYLGPKSFQTTPLTSNNLKYLTDKLIESDPSPLLDSAIINNNNDSLTNNNNKNILSTKTIVDVPKEMITVNNGTTRSDVTNNININIKDINLKISDSSDSSVSSYLSSPDESILTPLSTISSNDDAITNYNDNRTTVINDNETIIINNPNQQPLQQHHPIITTNNSSTRTITQQQFASKDPNSDSSASISTIIQPALYKEGNELSLPHPLLRKKSGELVKSSLKLPSLKRSNSMPNTNKFNANNRNKSVRFATVLEDVKFFNKLEKPTAVSAENSPIQSPIRTSWDLTSDSSDLEEEDDDDDDNDGAYDDKKIQWSIIKNDSPSTESFDFIKFKSNKPIILDCVKLGSNKDSIVGFVFVKNLSYQKKIVIRLTVDNWKSFVELDNTNYISSNHIFNYNKLSNSTNQNGYSSSSESYDRFSFIIKLNTLIPNYNQANSIDLKFCLRYDVEDVQYWDNNNDSNYHIILSKKQARRSSVSSSSKSRSNSASRSTFKLDNDYFNFNKLNISDEFDEDDNNFLMSNHHTNLLLDSEFSCDLKLKSTKKNRYSFDQQQQQQQKQSAATSPPAAATTASPRKLKHSNQYLLRKNLSAPSLAALSSPPTSFAPSFTQQPPIKLEKTPELIQKSMFGSLDFNKSKLQQTADLSSSSQLVTPVPPPAVQEPSTFASTNSIPPTESNIPKSLNSQLLYNKLIQNYCFFGSEESSPIGSPISNAYLSPTSNREFIDPGSNSLGHSSSNTGSPVRSTSKMEISPFYLH